MRILVISDTHGNARLAERALELSEPVECIIHLGDGAGDTEMLTTATEVQLIQVAGNCDYGSNAPRELLWHCEGKNILLAHGDAYGVKSGLGRLMQRANEVKADAVLYGHSHHPLIVTHSGIVFVNPGTLIRTARHKTYALVSVTTEGITAQLHDID